jgi:hypothetical protein
MRRKNRLNWCTLIALLIGLLVSAPAYCGFQQIAVDSGGVVEDYCKVTVGSTDVVWAACMSSGLFRATWSGTAYNDWTETRPGMSFCGVDAVYKSSNTTEYVIGGGGNGIWFNSSTSGSFTGWHRPNPNYYTDLWKTAPVTDVAFWYDNGATPGYNNPQTEFLVSVDDEGNAWTGNDGLYYWRTSDNSFQPVTSYSSNHKWGHFTRDVSDPNVLYIAGPPSSGLDLKGLNRISGTSYPPTATDIRYFDLAAMVNVDWETQEVLAISQWVGTSNVLTYVTMVYADNETNKYGIFLVTDLATLTDQTNRVQLLWEDLRWRANND